MLLAAADARAIEEHIARVEAGTGIQVVTMVADKSDAYPELPWVAFAIGVAMAALGVVVLDCVRPQWATASTAIMQSVAILCCGIACAAGTLWSRGFARLLLSDVRAATEARQAAEGAFLTRQLFATPQRTAILLHVSIFERHVDVVPDAGFRHRVVKRDWDSVVHAMTGELRAGHAAAAFHAGLDALERMLLAKGFSAVTEAVNSIADSVVQGDPA